MTIKVKRIRKNRCDCTFNPELWKKHGSQHTADCNESRPLRKGDLVRLTNNNMSDTWFKAIVRGYRKPTHDEYSEWCADVSNHSLNDAGESRLPPQYTSVDLTDELYIVVNARAKFPYFRKTIGGCIIMSPLTGQQLWVERMLFTIVSDSNS